MLRSLARGKRDLELGIVLRPQYSGRPFHQRTKYVVCHNLEKEYTKACMLRWESYRRDREHEKGFENKEDEVRVLADLEI